MSQLAALKAMLAAEPMVPEALSTGIRFLDRLLDGGVRPGASYLTVGAPGSGKTILWWQVAKAIDTLYIDTQDGLGTITASRNNSGGITSRWGSMLASLCDASRVIDTIAYRPQHIRLVVVDSIDSVTSREKIRPHELVRKMMEAAREPGSCTEHEDCRMHANLARACAEVHPKPPPAIVFTHNQVRGAVIPGVLHFADVVMSIDGPEVNRGVQRRSVNVLKNRFGRPGEARDLPLQGPTTERPYMHWPTT